MKIVFFAALLAFAAIADSYRLKSYIESDEKGNEWNLLSKLRDASINQQLEQPGSHAEILYFIIVAKSVKNPQAPDRADNLDGRESVFLSIACNVNRKTKQFVACENKILLQKYPKMCPICKRRFVKGTGNPAVDTAPPPPPTPRTMSGSMAQPGDHIAADMDGSVPQAGDHITADMDGSVPQAGDHIIDDTDGYSNIIARVDDRLGDILRSMPSNDNKLPPLLPGDRLSDILRSMSSKNSDSMEPRSSSTQLDEELKRMLAEMNDDENDDDEYVQA